MGRTAISLSCLSWSCGATARHQRALIIGDAAVVIELLELAVLPSLATYAAATGESFFAGAFAFAFLEHIRQVLLCDRQRGSGWRNALTIVWFALLLTLALHRRLWWTTMPLLFGLLAHVAMLLSDATLLAPVCLV